MWQTEYALAELKNVGVPVDFWLCSEGDFLTKRKYSLAMEAGDRSKCDPETLSFQTY